MLSTHRAIFVGTGDFALPILGACSEITQVVAVVTPPPRPKGKKKILEPSVVATTARTMGLPVYQPERLGDIRDILISLNPEVMVVAEYGQIIPASVLVIPPRGTVNVHPSLLPLHRGPAPVPATILAGDRETGVTLIVMDGKMDHGPILAQKKIALHGQERNLKLLADLAIIAAEMIRTTLSPFLDGEIMPVEQNHQAATSHSLLDRDAGRLEFTMTGEEVWRRFRALHPWPGVWIELPIRGRVTRLKIIEMSPADHAINRAPGTLIWSGNEVRLILKDSAITLQTIQIPGGKPLAGPEFYRGYNDIFLNE